MDVLLFIIIKKNEMKKINPFTIIIVCFITQFSYSQYYQKSFGKVFDTMNTDQQELQSIINFDQQNLIVSGTFRNVNTFPELAFYGTISKINKNGNVLWYKGYMPTNFNAYDSFFISSQVKTSSNEFVAIGTFLSESQNSGYILLKVNENGEVILSKKINDQLADLNAKIIYQNNNLYAILGNKVVKFDLQGNIINALSATSVFFRDITADSSGNIVLVGDYVSNDPNNAINTGLPVIRLTENLSFINGGIFHSETLGSLFAHSVIASTSSNLIIGGESIFLAINSNNNLLWGKMIPNFENLPISDNYNAILNFSKDSNDNIYFIANGFYSDADGTYEPNNTEEENFQYYTALCKINSIDGTITTSKEIKNGFLNSINHIEATRFFIENEFIYAAGSIRDFYGEYKLNYLHKSDRNGISCGETSRNISLNNISQEINYYPLTSDALVIINLQSSTLLINAVDIPINYENQSCSESLGLDDNEFDSVRIYPNPTSTNIVINGISNLVKVNIIDSLGRKVSQLSSNSSNQFDVSFLTSGIYIIEIVTNEKVYYKKLLKK